MILHKVESKLCILCNQLGLFPSRVVGKIILVNRGRRPTSRVVEGELLFSYNAGIDRTVVEDYPDPFLFIQQIKHTLSLRTNSRYILPVITPNPRYFLMKVHFCRLLFVSRLFTLHACVRLSVNT